MKFRAFLSESHQPVVETPSEKALRLRRGYRKIVRVDAAKFRDRYVDDQKQALNWHPGRLSAALSYDTFQGYPCVTFGAGKVDVIDGRHRLAAAASRQQTIDVATQPTVTLPVDVLV